MNIKKSTKVGILSILSFISINFMSINLQKSVNELQINVNNINENIWKISYRKNGDFNVIRVGWIFLDINKKVIKIYSWELDKEVILIYNEGTSYYLNQIKKETDQDKGKVIYKFFRSIDLLELKTWDAIDVIIKEDEISKRLIAVEITKTEDI